ncbi:MAG: hypothetical protein AAF802_03890 [Planctomycetota bacterium]
METSASVLKDRAEHAEPRAKTQTSGRQGFHSPIAWICKKLTRGTEKRIFHSHSYYDIHVFDSASRFVVGYQNSVVEKAITVDDEVEVGLVDCDAKTPEWQSIGKSRAWSWQQGPMAQFVPNTSLIVWNDREADTLCGRAFDRRDHSTRKLSRPVYAVSPDGKWAYSLNFDRLEMLRPGYGYASEGCYRHLESKPADDGIWRINLESGECDLILSIADAAKQWCAKKGWRFSFQTLKRRYRFWFNHIKVSPDGSRFTVKLRYRPRDLSFDWTDSLGVSLTANEDGSDVRFLADATSHVIWLDPSSLYLWRKNGVFLFRDAPTGGEIVKQFSPKFLRHNVHIRRLGSEGHSYVFDTPYRESIDLFELDEATGERKLMGQFSGHRPERGPYRCDLHPCPSPDAEKVLVTSMHDGGRQIYLLQRDS